MNKQEIKNILGGIDNPIILEIGCNDGEDSKQFLDTFNNIKLYCFEPDQRAIEEFRNRINETENRVSIFNIAISNKNGEVDFYMSDGRNPVFGDGWNKSSSIKKPKLHLELHRWCKFKTPIKVKTKTLDTWVIEENIPEIDFIWADVQGAEKELIEGGLETLNNRVKYFYTEFDNKELYEGQLNLEGIKKILPNFRQVSIIENNVLLRNKKYD